MISLPRRVQWRPRHAAPDAAGKLTYDDHGQVCLSFGKYQGWSLENIGRNDPGYLQWLMTKAELPGSTLAVMRSVLGRTGPLNPTMKIVCIGRNYGAHARNWATPCRRNRSSS